MNDKFTIRDFLAYFLTGLYLILTLYVAIAQTSIEVLNALMKGIGSNTTIIVFISIPILYLIGHFIHGIDYILFHIATRFTSFIDRKLFKIKSKYSKKTLQIILWLLNFHRIAGVLRENQISNEKFWKDCYILLIAKYERADYWKIMHILAEGVTLISFSWILYYAFYQINYTLSFIFFIVTLISWFRCRCMAENFVKVVRYSVEAINKSVPLFLT